MLRTPLYNFHVQRGGKMVDFAGWELPVLYTSIVEEHVHTRNAVSIFDISHMGRIELRGDGAEPLLQRVCTRQLGDSAVGQSRYSHVCNENGGILDDVIVSRYADHWLMVCNGANRAKILGWLRQQQGPDVKIDDKTESTLMVAIQGPLAVEKLSRKLPMPVADLKRYRFISGTYMFVPYTIFRSGYSGEDGLEIILPAMLGSMVPGWISDDNGNASVKPAGLGARDTLRLEAAMPLYGHELSEEIDTISAGLAWCVDLKKDFIGADALAKTAEKGPARKLVGLELEGKRIARQHAKVLHGGKPVGEVTSGTYGPTVQKSIAMAYVQSDLAQEGTRLAIDLGGKSVDALVVKLPFYSLKKNKQ